MTDEARKAADAVYQELLDRVGESKPAPRLEATRRAVELLGDVHRFAPAIHITGTNGKTTTSRIITSILLAHGLRVGTMTSPHLLQFTERILIDGEPINDELVASNWAEIKPYIEIVDAELNARGSQKLTFFEALTVLAFACFANAPVDVLVLEAGMGGEWDSTNVADGQVAVFTPIDLDHQTQLGDTIAKIARTKSGIIKPAASVVSAAQPEQALAELDRAAKMMDASFNVAGKEFDLVSTKKAVRGQVIGVSGLAGEYHDIYLPLLGQHQAQNATVAIAAVEAFLGNGRVPINHDLLEQGLASVTSPGRLQLIGNNPSVLVDAAHNPHGARSLIRGLADSFDFAEIAFVVGFLYEKDIAGIVNALKPSAGLFVVTTPDSERARPASEAVKIVQQIVSSDLVRTADDLGSAVEVAVAWAKAKPGRAVVVSGSIVLIGQAMQLAAKHGWSA